MPATRITYSEYEIRELLGKQHGANKQIVTVRIIKGPVDYGKEPHPDRVEFYVDLPDWPRLGPIQVNREEINWEAHRFKSGLIMDVSKCPSCKKPRTMYALRDADPPSDVNAATYSKALKESGECCNPKCNGVRGAGCWHCHSPEYFFDSLPEEGPECISDGCNNKGTVYRHCGDRSLVARCPACDDDLIRANQGDELIAEIKKKEFRWSVTQGLLTLALNWCRDNNEHGKKMPAKHAAYLLEAGILFWDPKYEMYDIIEPIKSWIEPAR